MVKSKEKKRDSGLYSICQIVCTHKQFKIWCLIRQASTTYFRYNLNIFNGLIIFIFIVSKTINLFFFSLFLSCFWQDSIFINKLSQSIESIMHLINSGTSKKENSKACGHTKKTMRWATITRYYPSSHLFELHTIAYILLFLHQRVVRATRKISSTITANGENKKINVYRECNLTSCKMHISYIESVDGKTTIPSRCMNKSMQTEIIRKRNWQICLAYFPSS